jgi:hypothetical protein
MDSNNRFSKSESENHTSSGDDPNKYDDTKSTVANPDEFSKAAGENEHLQTKKMFQKLSLLNR